MKFGISYEHQIPRPWDAEAKHRIYREAMAQVELADRVGIDYAREVEHHFLEEYSHSSAPEVFLAACSRRTKSIRLGHSIVLMPPGYNHPARVAERIAAVHRSGQGLVFVPIPGAFHTFLQRPPEGREGARISFREVELLATLAHNLIPAVG